MVSFVISMLIQNQRPVKIGHPQISRKHVKNTWNECNALQLINVVCAILERIFGVLPFITYSNEKYELSVYSDGKF